MSRQEDGHNGIIPRVVGPKFTKIIVSTFCVRIKLWSATSPRHLPREPMERKKEDDIRGEYCSDEGGSVLNIREKSIVGAICRLVQGRPTRRFAWNNIAHAKHHRSATEDQQGLARKYQC